MISQGALTTAGLNALPAQIALLDDTGEIAYTNRAWETFGRENDRFAARKDVGSNYLSVCSGSDDDDATAAAAGIRSVIDDATDEFTLEYPCHSPDERRWFTMRAAPFECDGDRFALVMHTNITERRLAEERVQTQADRMSGFARLLSHDLRNPLAVARAEAEMLSETGGPVGDGDGSESDHGDAGHDGIDALRSSLERMETIIDDGLVLVSAEADAVESTAATALETLATEAWSHVETGAARLDVDESVTIRADSDLASHLFENLFRNCIEHGGANPTVRAGPLEDGFYIEDDGSGIPPADRDRIFESGYTTAETGSGFGLAIVRRVAAAHGWSVAVTDGRGGGARFEITDVGIVPLE